MHYFRVTLDDTLYRRGGPDDLFFEVYRNGGWERAVGELHPSEQEEDHMTPITAAEAAKLQRAA
jgi:hypothetical protein